MASETTHEFTIVSGAHRGATFTLSDELLLIGADASCDVWLSDAGLAARHVAVTVDGRGVVVRPLDGTVTVDGAPVPPNARVAIGAGSEVSLGDSGVKLALDVGALEESRGANLAADSPSQLGPTGGEPATPGAPNSWQSKDASPTDGTRGAIGGSSSARTSSGRGASGGAADDGGPGSAHGPSGSRAAKGVQGADGPRAARRQSRVLTASLLVVGGVFAMGFSILQLRPSAAATASPAAHAAADAQPNESELLAQVRDVFRSNGYDVQLTQLGGANIRIDNLDGGHERVRRAAEQARADIPQLKSLAFASPDAATPPQEPPLYDDAPAGHMSLHVDTDSAYLVARDSRYFTGSTLPNGDTIRRITERAVQVERDGQIAWFRF